MITNNPLPSFKTIFGDNWNSLPLIMRKRYAICANNLDIIKLEGKMKINFTFIMSLFNPLLKLFKILVPTKGIDVPATVTYSGEVHSNTIFMERIFYFPDQSPYYFRSHIEPLQNNEIIEYTSLNFGVKMTCKIDGNKIIFQYKGYVIKIFNTVISCPISFIIGKVYVEEIPLSDDSYQMLMKITHPLFGNMFEYSGIFKTVQ